MKSTKIYVSTVLLLVINSCFILAGTDDLATADKSENAFELFFGRYLARNSEYQFNKFFGGQTPDDPKKQPLVWDDFLKLYSALPDSQRCYCALLIILNFDLDGEYSFAFNQAIKNDRASICKMLQDTSSENLKELCVARKISVEEFKRRALVYFGCELKE